MTDEASVTKSSPPRGLLRARLPGRRTCGLRDSRRDPYRRVQPFSLIATQGIFKRRGIRLNSSNILLQSSKLVLLQLQPADWS